MRTVLLLLFITFSLSACQSRLEKDNTAVIEQAKKEILQAEQDFSAMAASEGVSAAFLAFAAENAVLNRNDELFHGHNAMKRYFERSTLKNVSLQWQADFVDASASGDMGYTYGRYILTAEDAAGGPVRAAGIFHTVWKKQADGRWKFVYD